MAKVRPTARARPYIERRPGVRGGAPVVAGTGIRVLDVAVRYEVMRMTPDRSQIGPRGGAVWGDG